MNYTSALLPCWMSYCHQMIIQLCLTMTKTGSGTKKQSKNTGVKVKGSFQTIAAFIVTKNFLDEFKALSPSCKKSD